MIKKLRWKGKGKKKMETNQNSSRLKMKDNIKFSPFIQNNLALFIVSGQSWVEKGLQRMLGTNGWLNSRWRVYSFYVFLFWGIHHFLKLKVRHHIFFFMSMLDEFNELCDELWWNTYNLYEYINIWKWKNTPIEFSHPTCSDRTDVAVKEF